jgi:hypothetical protein
MTLQATSNDYFQTLTLDTPITTNEALRINVHGMRPLTEYNIMLNDIDYGWATRPWGKNLGDPIVSDRNGKVTVFILHEIPFEQSYSLDGIAMTTKKSQIRNQQNDTQPTNNMQTTAKVVQFVAPNSTVTIILPIRIWITLGHPNRSDHHGH